MMYANIGKLYINLKLTISSIFGAAVEKLVEYIYKDRLIDYAYSYVHVKSELSNRSKELLNLLVINK